MKPKLTPKLKIGSSATIACPMLQILLCGFTSKKGNMNEKKHYVSVLIPDVQNKCFPNEVSNHRPCKLLLVASI